MSDYFNFSDSNPDFAGSGSDTANQPWDFTEPAQHHMPSVHPIQGWEGMMAAAPTAPNIHQPSSSGMLGLGNAGTQTLHGQAMGLLESYSTGLVLNEWPSKQWGCAQCQAVFSTQRSLEAHAKEIGHSVFLCQECNNDNTNNNTKWFARYDSLQRHILSKHSTPSTVSGPRFPCPVCNRHDGEKAFTRRDHLNQHLRVFHKFDAKGIAHFKVRGGTREVPASLPLNSGPALPQAATPEFTGSLGQIGVQPMGDLGDGSMLNFGSFAENFPGF